MYNSLNGILVTMTVVFVILKFMGLTTMSWLWVFAPIWIPLAISVIFFVIFLILVKTK